MTFSVANGWAAKLGSVSTHEARLAMIAGSWWNQDSSDGYSGFNGPPHAVPRPDTYIEDSARTVRAILHWLTGKWTGASLLCVTENYAPDCGYSEAFANAFQTRMGEYGHSITVTGHQTSFQGFEPLDYDVFCLEGLSDGWNYHGETTAQGYFDYILANGTAILCSGNLYTAKYGFKVSSGGHHTINQPATKFHFNVDGPPQWRLQFPFANDWLGEPGNGGSWGSNLWATVWYSGCDGMVPDDANWTMGGSRLFSRCALGNYSLDPPNDNIDHDDDDADGMNLVGMWKET